MLICLATLPAILFTFYIAQNERNTALVRMEADVQHIVDLVSREHLNQMAGAKSLLAWLAGALEKEGTETLDSDSDFLAALLAGYPQLGNIAILEPGGNVINSAYPLPAPINMYDYDAIQRALHSHSIEVGNYVFGPIVGRPLLHLTYAVRDDSDTIRWVVFVAIDLEWLKKLTEQVDLLPEHILLIVDRDGRVLANPAAPDSNGFAIGDRIPALANVVIQNDQPIISAQINGEPLSFVTSAMKGLPGVLVASVLPSEQIYQQANKVFYRTLGWLGLLTLFTVISVLVVEEIALLRSVRTLSSAAQRFGQGDYTARVFIPRSYGELKDMADAFNEMAETLTHRHDEVTEANHRLDRLTRHLHVARESEAQRISRDLHDEVGQVLTSIKMDLASFKRKCKNMEMPPDANFMMSERIDIMQKKIDDIVVFIRRLASDLRPPVLDRMGLVSAIDLLARNLEQNSELVINVETDDAELPMSWLVSTTIYRIVQEALTNIARHAEASEVHIDINLKDDEIILVIGDNGKGFEYRDAQKEALGIIGMRERARLVSGVFDLESGAGKGTVISVTIPYRPNENEESDEHAYPAG